jgi:hypothetical protein
MPPPPSPTQSAYIHFYKRSTDMITVSQIWYRVVIVRISWGGTPDWVTNKFDPSKELRIIWRDLKRRFPPSSWSQQVDTSSGETIECRFTGLHENSLRNRQRIVGVFYLTVCMHRFNLNEGEGSRSSRFLTKYWQWCPSYYMCGQRHCIDQVKVGDRYIPTSLT